MKASELRTKGPDAAGPKRPWTWSTPPRIAATQMNGMKGSMSMMSLIERSRSASAGSMMRAISRASSITAVSRPVAIASTPTTSEAKRRA